MLRRTSWIFNMLSAVGWTGIVGGLIVMLAGGWDAIGMIATAFLVLVLGKYMRHRVAVDQQVLAHLAALEAAAGRDREGTLHELG